MSPDISKITDTVLEFENAINARWNNGDCTGFLEAYREDVTYFDPLTDRCLIGRQAVKEHFDKYFTGAPVVRSEQFNPKVVARFPAKRRSNTHPWTSFKEPFDTVASKGSLSSISKNLRCRDCRLPSGHNPVGFGNGLITCRSTTRFRYGLIRVSTEGQAL